jgi:hypothetical protein
METVVTAIEPMLENVGLDLMWIGTNVLVVIALVEAIKAQLPKKITLQGLGVWNKALAAVASIGWAIYQLTGVEQIIIGAVTLYLGATGAVRFIRKPKKNGTGGA